MYHQHQDLSSGQDTSRHYQPLSAIKNVIDSMTYAKLIGLKGEALSLNTLSRCSSVEWKDASEKQPLTWYNAFFNVPGGSEPLALDMSSMGKGQLWINRGSIGRYWPGYIASGSCGPCDYCGTYDEKKCQSNCGESSQRCLAVSSQPITI